MRDYKMSEENINVEEEPISEERSKEKKAWEEHLHVDSDELVGKVQELIKEAAVRKITIKDETGKTVLTIPMYAGLASLLVFGPWNALALLAAWVAKFSIIIERDAPVSEEEIGEEKEPVAVSES
jgi:hypothetical protein